MRWRVTCARKVRDTPSMPKVKLACSMGLAWPKSFSCCKNGCGLFRRQAIQQGLDMRIGVAELGRCSDCFFRVIGMGNQLYQHIVPLFFSGA